MIGAQKWWSIIEDYGAQIWPAQAVFYIAAILLTGWLFIKPGKVQSWLTKLYLSIAFAWNGIVFFLTLAGDITGESYGNYFFGSLFIIVSALFARDLFRHKMQFSLPANGWIRYTTITLIALVFCYPLFGIALGHDFRRLIVPGTFPCPTTALGLLFLTTALPRVDKIAYILLLLWAIPFPTFIQIPKYGVYEDTIMFLSGLYSLVLLIKYWRAPH
ncbi:MAG: hypothetical protein JXA79_03000 [Deltaproteobacteria bacterium]|nr:hypothetical protein [Deltaproteobacteria bacterium]